MSVGMMRSGCFSERQCWIWRRNVAKVKDGVQRLGFVLFGGEHRADGAEIWEETNKNKIFTKHFCSFSSQMELVS